MTPGILFRKCQPCLTSSGVKSFSVDHTLALDNESHYNTLRFTTEVALLISAQLCYLIGCFTIILELAQGFGLVTPDSSSVSQ